MALNFDLNSVAKMFAEAERIAPTLTQETYDYFVDSTPVRSGNARRSTSLRGSVIDANYAYAQRLDQGWSRQAPRGMTEPTEKFLQKRITDLIKRIP